MNFNEGKGSVVLVSYSRGTLNQTGTGHFSPVGGYCEAQDLVLILDVARFKYPPHWIPLALLFQAMQTIDPETSLSRGYLIISSSDELREKWCRIETQDCCRLDEDQSSCSGSSCCPDSNQITALQSPVKT